MRAKNNREYFSIGEVAKLKGIGIRALRYYDRIGICRPDYVDPQTHYRYYSYRQLVTLDSVESFLEAGIPLATQLDYRDSNGNLEMDRLLRDESAIVQEKLQHLSTFLKRNNYVLNRISQDEPFLNIKETYTRNCEPLKIMYMSGSNAYFGTAAFNEKLLEIKALANKNEIEAMPFHGSLYVRKNSPLAARIKPVYNISAPPLNTESFFEEFVFVEVDPDTPEKENVLTIPGGPYLCNQYPDLSITQFPQQLKSEEALNQIDYLAVVCLSERTIHYDSLFFEVRRHEINSI